MWSWVDPTKTKCGFKQFGKLMILDTEKLLQIFLKRVGSIAR